MATEAATESFTEFAAAKVNLCLHVTGQRADGYHLLDSIVAFADIGDDIVVRPSGQLSLTIDGVQAEGLSAGEDNLVLRAARFLDPERTADIRLTKRLPQASGIGGGSADAAATLLALAKLWDVPLPGLEQTAKLGADVPACLLGEPLRLRGIGDQISALPDLPEMDVLLVNPGVSVSTPAVFAALARRENPSLPDTLPSWSNARAFCDWLSGQRNDLLTPAIGIAPVIAEVLEIIGQTDCLYAGMSGSGATCFGLYPPDRHSAKAARAALYVDKPEWWAAYGCLGGRTSQLRSLVSWLYDRRETT